MMPHVYQRKRTQDAMRREQQADEHIRELEERIEELEAGIAALVETLESNANAAAEYDMAQQEQDYSAAAQLVREQFPRLVDLDSDNAPALVEEMFEQKDRIEELEAEVERLREALHDARNRFAEIEHPDYFPVGVDDVREISKAARQRMDCALDGGGDND